MNNYEKIRSINSPGWDGVNAQNTIVPVQNVNDMHEMDQCFKRVFSSTDGKKVLELLCSETIEQPTWVPGAADSFGYARDGQNSIVRQIIARIKRADEFR